MQYYGMVGNPAFFCQCFSLKGCAEGEYYSYLWAQGTDQHNLVTHFMFARPTVTLLCTCPTYLLFIRPGQISLQSHL